MICLLQHELFSTAWLENELLSKGLQSGFTCDELMDMTLGLQWYTTLQARDMAEGYLS